jgi:hypothetical protein
MLETGLQNMRTKLQRKPFQKRLERKPFQKRFDRKLLATA